MTPPMPPIHAARRHARGANLSSGFSAIRLGGAEDARHQRRVLQAGADHVGRIDDAGLDEVR